jgi:DNA-binding CsgD family transcriptional regulator
MRGGPVLPQAEPIEFEPFSPVIRFQAIQLGGQYGGEDAWLGWANEHLVALLVRLSGPDLPRKRRPLVLGKAGSRFRLENENWVVVSRDHRRPLAIHAVPIQPDALGGIHTALVLVDLEEAPEPNPSVLQKIFGLTAAEADLAIRVARGDTPAKISKQRETTVSTVRSQLASVFRKTKTTRQADLLSLIARVAILP